ncbi:MAG: cohesin domain-containing protein [Patescibacteria group bacterium]
MKKILTSIITLSAITLFALPVSAATNVVFTPATASITAGQTFTMTVAINPNGASNYAEKVEIKYPAGMLEVRNFTLNSAWTALNQPGYDLIDNANGVLIKSAGYPAGFTSTATFGTITFYAKTAGTASVSVGSNSIAFDANSQSTLVGTPATVTIGAYVAPATPIVQTPSPVVSTATNTSATTSDITAAVGDTDSKGSATLYTSLAIIAVLVIGGIAYFVTKKA